MRRILCSLSLVLSIAISVAFCDDQQKAEKQVRRITAMATDKTGRRMVSMSIADTLKVSRPSMIEERRKLGLDYGSFFVAHELLAAGLQASDLIQALKASKTIWQIGNDRRANWGKIAGDAKRQNAKIEDYIYRHFLNKKNTEADEARDLLDKYDPTRDGVRTDFAVTPQEMVDAEARYIFWRDQAGKTGPGRAMTVSERMAADMDHADAQHNTNGGISAPAAGGLPTH